MQNDDLTLDVLIEKYESLKDEYDDAYAEGDGFIFMCSFAEDIIARTLDIDAETGTKMWEYMLNMYWNKIDEVDYSILIGHVIDYTDSYKSLEYAFTNSDIICKCTALDPYENHLYLDRFIGNLIFHSNYSLAQMLIDLLLQNNSGENNPQTNLFELCEDIMTDEAKWLLDSDGLDFISELIKKVENKNKRNRLEVKFVSIADCVENGAPRGAMPFSLFMKEDGVERFLENKSREENNSFDIYSKERCRKKEQKKAKQESETLKPGKVDNQKLSDYQAKLEKLVGLSSVKNEVKSLANFIQVRELRISRNISVPDMSQHLVFAGNPGTGKTTVARLIGQIYNALGFLSKGHFIEVDRSDLVAGYVGQTAIKTQEKIDKALGGVLFIDEAYSLSPKYKEDFGAEAIETLLKAMEDYREDFVVIVAGYDELMKEFISSNPGLKSRFSKTIYFPDYTGDELLQIFLDFLEQNNYEIDSKLLPLLSNYFEQMYINRDNIFGNARDVRNLFEKVISNQANRIVNLQHPNDKDILEIQLEDFNGVI